MSLGTQQPDRHARYEARRRSTIDRGLRPNCREKTERIDLGMELLLLARGPNQTFSHFEIAAWCGCTGQAIRRIEQEALKRLRKMGAVRAVEEMS